MAKHHKLKPKSRIRKNNKMMAEKYKQRLLEYERMLTAQDTMKDRFLKMKMSLNAKELEELHTVLINKVIHWMMLNEYFEQSLIESLNDIDLLFEQIVNNNQLALYLKNVTAPAINFK